jgi:methyl-accepting chemotaxis protein
MQEWRLMWEKLKNGEMVKTTQRLIINNAETWLAETYIPIIDERGGIKKILKIAYNITTEKIKERELKDAIEEVAKIRASQSRTIDKLVERAERKEQKLKQEIQKLKEKFGQ